MTPAEHLIMAEGLLASLEDLPGRVRDSRSKPMDIPDVIRLATAHITLALALNAVPMIEDAGAILREGREDDERHRRRVKGYLP